MIKKSLALRGLSQQWLGYKVGDPLFVVHQLASRLEDFRELKRHSRCEWCGSLGTYRREANTGGRRKHGEHLVQRLGVCDGAMAGRRHMIELAVAHKSLLVSDH